MRLIVSLLLFNFLLHTVFIMSSVVVDPLKAVKFFSVLGRLKTLKRTGWVNNEIALPESVADHMYRMSMLSFLITDPEVHKDRLMKICMVHDVAEAVVGDITPYDGVSKEDKRIMEENALKQILADLEAPEIASEIYALWMEYEEGTSKEAHLARELDKLEMIIQANEYEQQQPGKRLERFFASTQDSFTSPEILSWAQQIRKEHYERFPQNEVVTDTKKTDL